MSHTQELRARLFLLRAAEPPAPATHHYVTVHGAVDAMQRILARATPPAVLAEIRRPNADIDEDLRLIDNGVFRLLTPENDDWPLGRLGALSRVGAPLALWVRGTAALTDLSNTAVTVTGSMTASSYGTTVAAKIGHDLATATITVVTGGSFGIDEATLRGVLAANGPATIVLPNGIDQDHPTAHAHLFHDIIDGGGLVISEYPPGARPTRRRFAARSRLLAALSGATVIVEASQRGPELTTARAATELHRPLYGIPGPIHSATSAGVHELLRTGAATLITSANQINYNHGLR